jgi:hypothetical protein
MLKKPVSVFRQLTVFVMASLAFAAWPLNSFAQNGATFVNNEQRVDGIGITGTQQIYAAPAYNWGNSGGVIHWINARSLIR